MILHVHKERTDKLSLTDVANDLPVQVLVENKYLINFKKYIAKFFYCF